MSISIIQTSVLAQITHICSYLNPVGYPYRTTLNVIPLRCICTEMFIGFVIGLNMEPGYRTRVKAGDVIGIHYSLPYSVDGETMGDDLIVAIADSDDANLNTATNLVASEMSRFVTFTLYEENITEALDYTTVQFTTEGTTEGQTTVEITTEAITTPTRNAISLLSACK